MTKKVISKKRKGWTKSNVKNGVIEIKCKGWPSFQDFLNKYLKETRDYIWRGERCDNWPLLPSLDRKLKKKNTLHDKDVRNDILTRFKLSIRGREEKYLLKSNSEEDNENRLWALGQHNGLLTPLLDWSFSPYIAAYFAFREDSDKQTKNRAVYGLSAKLVSKRSKSIGDKGKGIKFVSPFVGDNPRLIQQRALFTKTPVGVDIESWVKKNISSKQTKWVLIKILIQNTSREKILKSLDRMAVSPLELFPDIEGACRYCNHSIEIDDYCQRLTDKDIFSK